MRGHIVYFLLEKPTTNKHFFCSVLNTELFSKLRGLFCESFQSVSNIMLTNILPCVDVLSETSRYITFFYFE